MATYSANGSGSQFSGYMHARVEVTRTDYDTYSSLYVVCKVVSDGGSSSFISGRCTASTSGYGAYSSEQSVSAYGSTTLKTATFTVTRGTSSKTQTCKAAILGGGTGMYAGKYDEASVSVSIPAISYDAPNAPTGASATYVSDSQATVAWTNGSTTATKPRTATVVERQTDGGAWAQIASVASNATGYTDNGIEPNHQYVYRVAAQNSVGLSSYATSSAIYTTPAAPASVTLDKTSATAVTVDVTGSAPYATGYDIESTYDNGATWSTVASGTSLPYSATVGAGTVQFRVRSVRSTLESAWTLSASLVTITPPLAPTITAAPANPTSYGDSVTITWTPNHPDGSAQDHAEVKVTDPGGTSTTYTVAGTTTTYSFTPNVIGVWTAQVRTYGLDPSAGAWSSTISWGVYNPPAVVITTPASDGTTVAALPLSVAWTVTDGTGVSAQRIIVADLGGNQLLNRMLPAADRSASFGASDLSLADGESYAITVRVMGGSGLITTAVRTFNVAWTQPTPSTLSIYEGDGQSATISVVDTRYFESGETVEASTPSMLESITVHGKSVQDGTPTPGTPVPIECVQSRNLLDVSSVTSATVNGITWTANGDGTFTANDTASSNSTIGLGIFTFKSGTSYRVSGCPTGGGSSSYEIMVQLTTSSSSGAWKHEYGNGTTFTGDGAAHRMQLVVRSGTTVDNILFKPMLKLGNADARFQPYGSISVIADSTTTPIDLQGHALRSLPDGTEDTLTVDAAGNVTLVQAIEETYTAATDGVTGTVGVDVLSSTGQIADSAQVIYKLATPQTISLGTISMPYVEDELWVDAVVTPTIDATLRPAESPGQPPADTTDIIRVNPDGSTWTVASNLADGASCIDPLPPLGVPVEYRAIASASSGATATAVYSETFGGKDWMLNFGAGAQEFVDLTYNPQAAYSLVQGGASYHFADGGAGRGRPVFYPTSDRDESGTLKFATIGQGKTDRLRDLLDRYPVCWLRDPFGHRWRARVKPSSTHGVGSIFEASLSWDAVRWEEAW